MTTTVTHKRSRTTWIISDGTPAPDRPMKERSYRYKHFEFEPMNSLPFHAFSELGNWKGKYDEQLIYDIWSYIRPFLQRCFTCHLVWPNSSFPVAIYNDGYLPKGKCAGFTKEGTMLYDRKCTACYNLTLDEVLDRGDEEWIKRNAIFEKENEAMYEDQERRYSLMFSGDDAWSDDNKQ